MSVDEGVKVWRPRVRGEDLSHSVNININEAMDIIRNEGDTGNSPTRETAPLTAGLPSGQQDNMASGAAVVSYAEPIYNFNYYDDENVHETEDRHLDSLHINDLPDKLVMHILSYVPHVELVKTVTLVCKKWRLLCRNGMLWNNVSFRSEYCKYYISLESVLALISVRFVNCLKSIDLPSEMITVTVIQELSAKCPTLRRMTLDFSKATQLYDFTDLTCFPSSLYSLCLCLSEVVFLEGLMRRVYNFLSSLKVLHLIGTVETSNGDEEIFEVVNIGKIRSHTPNLRIVNLFGVTFVDDVHIEMLASSCIHLEVLAVNFCLRVKGSSLKTLTSRCKKLHSLLLRHTDLRDEYMAEVDWFKCRHMEELDISCTDLSENTILELLNKLPPLTFLSAAHCDFFSDKVLRSMLASRKLDRMRNIDLSYTYSLNEAVISDFLRVFGRNLRGLMLHGKPKLAEQFWLTVIPLIPNISLSRVHIDQVINSVSSRCSRIEEIEIQWEPDTIRYSEKSSKYIDFLRIRCAHLRAVTLADGGYYEMVKSNFERADRPRIVRVTNQYSTSILSQLKFYNELLFN